MQFIPPDVFAKTVRIAKSNEISVEELIERNDCLSLLMWQVIRIFETNLRFFMNQKLSYLTGDKNWWRNPKLIYEKHISRAPYALNVYEVINLGFLLLLFSDRYHNKIWVPCLRNELMRWKRTRRDLYFAFRDLVQVRNRIAHHEIIYNYPLIEILDFTQEILADINEFAAEEIRTRNLAESINRIRLGSGGGI
jgi:hypothetical protein